MPVLDPTAGDALVETVAAEAGRVAALLAGDLPHTLVEHAEEAGVELLPYGGELGSTCTCQAWTDPCPHALAVMYQLAWLVEATRSCCCTCAAWPATTCWPGCTSGRPARRPSATTPTSTSPPTRPLRAARVLDLLEDPDASTHLF